MNVHTLASELSASRAETEYTAHITRISTLITSLVLLPLTIISAGASSYIHLAREAAKVATGAVSHILRKAILKGLLAGAIQFLTIPIQAMTEEFEELYIDPAIEKFMLNWAAQSGTPQEVAQFWATFVSSFREAFMGGASAFVSKIGGFDSNTNTQSGKLSLKIQNLFKMIKSQTQKVAKEFEFFKDQNENAGIPGGLDTKVVVTIDKEIKSLERESKRNFLDLISADRIASIAFSIPSMFVGGGGMFAMTQLLDLGSDALFQVELEYHMPESRKKQAYINNVVNELNAQRDKMHKIDGDLTSEVRIALTQAQKTQENIETIPAVKQLESLITSSTDAVSQAQISNIPGFISLGREIELIDDFRKFQRVKENILKSIEMVNSESVSNEILIQKFRKKGEGTIMVFLEGLSMFPKFEPGSLIPVKIMRTDAEYEVGDIVLFNRNGIYVVHEVSYKYTDTEGTIRYTTRGLNHETNPRVDRGTLSGDQILGIADLSEEFLAGIPALENQGLLFQMKAYGMENQFDSLLQRAKNIHEIMTNIDQNNKEAALDVILDYMKLLIEFKQYDITHLDISNQFIGATIEADLLASYLHIVTNIFTGYSADLFKQMISKVFGNVLDPRNPRVINGDLNEAFDKLKTLTKIIIYIDNFYGLEKANYGLQDYLIIQSLDDLTNLIWEKSYTELLEESARVDKYSTGYSPALDAKFGTDYKKIGFASVKEIHETIYSNTLGSRVITGNIIGPSELWVKIGSHNYVTLKGGIEKGGIEHMWQNHREDFKRWGCNSIQDAIRLILDTVSNKKGVQIRNNVACYKIKDINGNDDYIGIAYEVNDHYLLNAFRLYDELQSDARFSNIFELIDKINK